MKPLISICFFFLLALPGINYAQTTLKAGDKAPDFTAKNQDGKEISLSQFKGRKVILYFYPKDNSAGCTAEAISLRDHIAELEKKGYKVLGVSTDDEASHKDFQVKNALPFPLIADVDKSIHMKYGVWNEKERFGVKKFGTTRTTFLIDQKGYITSVIQDVDTKYHASQILTMN